MKYFSIALFFVFSTACGSEEDSDNKNSQTSGNIPNCELLSEEVRQALDKEDCIAADCTPSIGYSLNGTAGGYIGCNEYGFNNQVTYGRHPETGECWTFSSNGPPNSWGGMNCTGTNNNTATNNNTVGTNNTTSSTNNTTTGTTGG